MADWSAARVEAADRRRAGRRRRTAPSPIVNPATEEVVGQAPEASVDQALDAARAAQEAFPAWSATPAAERAALLTAVTDQLVKLPGRPRAADHLRDRRHRSPSARACRCRSRSSASSRYARDAAKNLGIPLPPSPVAGHAARAGRAHGRVREPSAGRRGGVHLAVQLPAHQHRRQDRARARGRLHRRRSSPRRRTRSRSCVLAEIMHEVGFPPGVVNVVTSADAAARGRARRRAATSTWCRSPAPPRSAQAHLRGRRQHDEAPAARARRQGRRRSCSTTPTSTSRSPPSPACGRSTAGRSAPRRRARSCTAAATTSWSTSSRPIAGNLKVGDPLDEDTIVGPVISAAQRDRIEALHRRRASTKAPTSSSTVARPGNMDRGFYVAPTLLAECKPGMSAGAGGDLRSGGRRRAVRRRRRSRSPSPTAPTSASTTTCSPHDSERGFRIAGRLRSGNVGINTAQRNMEAPFGGFKMSGIGRDGGDFGLLAYTEMQSVMWPG